jgi:hypothetical protein
VARLRHVLAADVEHIRYELITFLIASRDTVSAQVLGFRGSCKLKTEQTSSLLTFVIYFLALHPDVCHRLREEVLDTFGPAGSPTYEHLKKMPYRAFNCLIRASVILNLVTEWLLYLSPCRAQGDTPSFHLRPAYCTNVSQPTTRHPGLGQAVSPTQDADHDVFPPCT